MNEHAADARLDEQAVQEIARRVTAALRSELETIAAELASRQGSQPLTVEQLAERFGVARSTVYAHWREWGGYKLGESPKAPIRFPPQTIPTAENGQRSQQKHQPPPPTTTAAPRRSLLRPSPRLPPHLGDQL